MKPRVDINADIGESYGQFTVGNDEALVPWLSSANIAVGMHAGDPFVLSKTLDLCKKNQVKVGAHPGYMDLHGFGRRSVKMESSDFDALMVYQLGAFKAMCDFKKIPFHHVKPHGALYNDLMTDHSLARRFVEIVKHFDSKLMIYGLPDSAVEKACHVLQLKFVSEIFIDRRYSSEGLLVPRTHKKAIVQEDEAIIEGALRWLETGKMKSLLGEDIDLRGDSICIHGDHPKSVEIAQKLVASLQLKSISIEAL